MTASSRARTSVETGSAGSICPSGKLLQTSGTVHDGRTLLYRASKRDCDGCPIRAKCCTTADARKIPRDLHEDARDVARRKMKTKAFARSRDERKRVEMRFAHLKIYHGFERMRLRGLSGARDEFHLAAIVQNLDCNTRATFRNIGQHALLQHRSAAGVYLGGDVGFVAGVLPAFFVSFADTP